MSSGNDKCVCVRACVRVCVRARVRVCVRVSVRVYVCMALQQEHAPEKMMEMDDKKLQDILTKAGTGGTPHGPRARG